MKGTKIAVTLAIVVLAGMALLYGQADRYGQQGQAGQQYGQQGQAGQMSPEMMTFMFSQPAVDATGDGGAVVLAGSTLLKYDENLRESARTEVQAIVAMQEQIRSRMQAMSEPSIGEQFQQRQQQEQQQPGMRPPTERERAQGGVQSEQGQS